MSSSISNDSNSSNNSNPIKLSNIKNLVLSGGGLLGISYIGLFKYLEENNATKQIKTVSGCSAGAIFGSLFAVGYKSDELNIIVKSMNFKEFLNITADSIINFMRTKGLESGKNLMNFIKKCIKDKTGNEDITFCQIQERFNIKLSIGVTNLTTSKFELLGCHNMPNLPIYQAINASIAIPFIFEPVIINNDVCCDGGLLDNLPIEEIITLEDNNNMDIGIDIDIYKPIEQPIQPTQPTQPTQLEQVDENINTKENPIPRDKRNTEDKKNIIEVAIIDTLGIYLMNKFNILSQDNYQLLPLSYYFNAITQALSNGYISKKKNKENNKKYKVIVFEIPCDIMTFIKINASIEDIDNIINIAYTITKNNLDISNIPITL
jgi:NTE family protein